MKFLLTILAVFCSLFLVSCSSTGKPVLKTTDASEFKPGQVWNYKTRANEAGSTVLIQRVEIAGDIGTVVHVTVDGLKIKNPREKSGEQNRNDFLPFTESALKQSVTVPASKTATFPDFSEVYQEWRKAYMQNNATAWTMPVAEAV